MIAQGQIVRLSSNIIQTQACKQESIISFAELPTLPRLEIVEPNSITPPTLSTIKVNILLRDDSCLNIEPAPVAEFTLVSLGI
jgi:hypothetical protein